MTKLFSDGWTKISLAMEGTMTLEPNIPTSQDFNLSNITLLQDHESTSLRLQGYQKLTTVSVLILVVVLGSVGNSLVIVAVALSRKLQTTTNIYVVALAVVDLLTALNQIVHVAVLTSRTKSRALHLTCTVTATVNGNFLGYSVCILILITINRLQVITSSAPNARDTRRKAAASILVVLLLISVPVNVYNVFRENGKSALTTKGFCAIGDIGFGAVMLLFGLIILICYAKIFLHLRRHFRRIGHIHDEPSVVQDRHANTSSVSVIDTTVDLTATTAVHEDGKSSDGFGLAISSRHSGTIGRDTRGKENHRPSNWSKAELKVTINMLIVVVSFIVCILPSAWMLIAPGTQDRAWVAFLILVSNCCWNPVIYAWKHPDFKRTMKCIICGKFSQIEDPASWLRIRMNAI